MSLMSMRRKMASKKTATYILWVLIFVMAASIYFGFGMGTQSHNLANNPAAPGNNSGVLSSTVATVNGQRISSGEYSTEFAKSGGSQTIDNILDARKAALTTLIDNMLKKQALKTMKVDISNREFNKLAEGYIRSTFLDSQHQAAEKQAKEQAKNPPPAETKDKAKDPKDKSKPAAKDKPKTADQIFSDNVIDIMKKNGKSDVKGPMTDDLFVKWFINDYIGKNPSQRESFIDNFRMQKMGEMFLAKQPVPADVMTNEALGKALNTKESNVSWIFIAADKQDQASLDAAGKKITAIRADVVKDPKAFERHAADSSDKMSSPMGGSLDWMSQGRLPVLAEYYAFTMKKGELSPVFLVNYASPYERGQKKLGYAILKVNGIRDMKNMPKDFDWAKQKDGLMYNLHGRYSSEFGEEYVALFRLGSKINSPDLEMQSYLAENNGDLTQRDNLRKKLVADAKLSGRLPYLVAAGLNYQLATRPGGPVSVKDRIKYLVASTDGVDNVANLHFELGRAYLDDKQNDRALSHFKQAYDALQGSDENVAHNLEMEFHNLKDMTDWAKAKKWIADHEQKTPPPGGGGRRLSGD